MVIEIISPFANNQKNCNKTQMNNKQIYLLLRSHSTCRYKQGNWRHKNLTIAQGQHKNQVILIVANIKEKKT